MNETHTLMTPTSDETTMASLAHILQIVAWWIAPLIIYLTKRDSKFVSFHAMQALIWQVAFMIIWIVGICLWMVVMFSTISPHMGEAGTRQAPPTAFFVVFPIIWLVLMGLFALNLVIGIVYGIKAGRGEWASYPLIGRWAHRIVGA